MYLILILQNHRDMTTYNLLVDIRAEVKYVDTGISEAISE